MNKIIINVLICLTISSYTYSQNLFIATGQNGKMGLVNETEKFVIQPIYDDLETFQAQYAYRNEGVPDNFFIATINGKRGLLNYDGKVLLNCVYDDVMLNNNIKTLIITAKNKKLYAFFGMDGKQLTPFKYTSIDTFNSEEYGGNIIAAVTPKGKKELLLIDIHGNELTRNKAQDFELPKPETPTTFAISNNGHYFASGADDNTFCLWNIENNTLVWKTNIYLPKVSVFSADDKLIAVGCDNGKIAIFDVTTGKLIFEQYGHRNCDGEGCSIFKLKFSPLNKYLVSGGTDEYSNFWNIQTGQSLMKPVPEIYSVEFTPDENYMLIGEMSVPYQIYKLNSDKPKKVLETPKNKEGFYIGNFTSDGKYFIFSDNTTVAVYSAPDFKLSGNFPAQYFDSYNFKFEIYSDYLYIFGPKMECFDMKSKNKLYSIPCRLPFTFDNKNNILMQTAEGDTLQVINPKNGTVEKSIPYTYQSRDDWTKLVYQEADPENTIVLEYYEAWWESYLRYWNLTTGQCSETINFTAKSKNSVYFMKSAVDWTVDIYKVFNAEIIATVKIFPPKP